MDTPVGEGAHPAKRRRTTPPAPSAAPQDPPSLTQPPTLQPSTTASFALPTQASMARGRIDPLQLRLANASAAAHNRENSTSTATAAPDEARGLSARPRRSIRSSPTNVAPPAVDIPEADTSVSFLLLNKPLRPRRRTKNAGGQDTSAMQGDEATRELQRSPVNEESPSLPLPPINDPVATSPGPNAKGIHAKKKGAMGAADGTTTKPKSTRRGKHRPPEPRVSVGYWHATVGVGGDNISGDEGTQRRTRSATQPNPARGVSTSEAHDEKRKERDRLREQLDKLKKDLRQVEREEDRMRRHTQRGDGFTLRNPEQMFQLLGRHLLPQEGDTPPEPAALVDAMVENPIAWLPFGNMSALLEAAAAPPAPEEEKMPPPLSHHPLEMSSEEELPFLQLFSPFTLSQTTTLLRPESPSDPLLQQHMINLASTTPRGAFTAQVHLTVDTTTLAITELSFPRIDPAAAPELRPFLDDLCRKGRTRSLANNVSVATWAMGEWCRVALERAAFWRLLENEMGTEDGVANVAKTMRAQRRYKAQPNEDDAAEEREWKVSEVLPHMGQTSIEIGIPGGGVEASDTFVRMQWNIALDWTGDARSELSVLVGMPGKWTQADNAGTLGNVAGLWKNLIDQGEKPATAVRTLVALLAGDQN